MPNNYNMIRIEWILKNKQSTDGIVLRSKVKLGAQGYTQLEGLHFGETYHICPSFRIWGYKDSIDICLCS